MSFVVLPMSWVTVARSAASKCATTFLTIVVAATAVDLALRAWLPPGVRTTSKVLGGADAVATGSLMADVLAYNVIGLCFAFYSSHVGVGAWFDGRAAALSGTPLQRLYGHSQSAEELCVVVTAYELFNLISVLLLPEYRTAAFVGHHGTTLLLGVLSFHPWCYYYILFFFGVSAASSVPLCLGELFNSAGLTGLAAATRPLFALLFLGIRSVYWPLLSLRFWRDAAWAMRDREKRVHSVGAFAILLTANIGLTGLQWLWTGQILSAVMGRATKE